jgi:hypothetical protein
MSIDVSAANRRRKLGSRAGGAVIRDNRSKLGGKHSSPAAFGRGSCMALHEGATPFGEVVPRIPRQDDL